jgi:hypothetical protein
MPALKKAGGVSMSEGRGAAGSVSARLEKELERTLREFVRMRTVSSDPSLREDCFKGAKYLAHLLESLGKVPVTKVMGPRDQGSSVVRSEECSVRC